MKKQVRVLIAGVGSGGYGLEIMKALRLSKVSYRICGVDMSKESLGFLRADQSYVIPPAFDKKYIPTLLNICRKEKIQAVFPGSEPDLKKLSDHREIFEREGIFFPFNSKKAIDLCIDKKETFAYLKGKKIPIPKTIVIKSNADINRVNFLPVIIKPSAGGGGSNNTFIAQDKKELELFCQYMLKYRRQPLVQEYIGSPKEEYTISILSDKDGKIISSVVIHRYILSGLSNRLKIPSLGNRGEVLAVSSGISQGEIVKDKDIIDQSKKISLVVDSRGPLNIQGRLAEGVLYPFEINPRFSGTTYMRALAGVNEPDLFIRKYILKEHLPKNIIPKYGKLLRELKEIFLEEKS